MTLLFDTHTLLADRGGRVLATDGYFRGPLLDGSLRPGGGCRVHEVT